MEKIKVASLFCGCGGMDLGVIGGFSYLGKEYKENPFEIVYAVDNDEYCTKIYNDNFTHKCEVKDVRDIKIGEMPQFDMLIGGFPCQSFSISAQNPPRLGYKDERGMLFFEMVKILKERQPRFFIAENVKGILSANKGKAFPMIMKEFRDAGYIVVHKLLNASEYGVPQKRERVIIIGFRNKEDYLKFHYPIKVKTTDRKVLGDVIMEESNHDETLFFSDKAVTGMMAVREKMNKGRAMSLTEPCNTISAHLAKVSLNSTDPVFMVGERYRRFSAREAARIQSFPDYFRFDAVSQIRQYKAIGNAVPPVMMWHIIHSLQKTLVISQVDFAEIKGQYPVSIIENKEINNLNIDKTKNVLISLVKEDNMEQYLDRSAKVYYTGKKFPSTVALNKLYYFMPYMKRKGIRDLYFIKVARVGTRKEGQPDENKNDLRLVFEIDFVGQIFDDYKPIKLDIWRTFTDTTVEKIMI
ncbi:DNA (cytosine-5-)-methyltransferase [Bacteroides fragilis]|uniref:DNA (cytosine-5-)-methyltransferase n=1 Tax=Bacteroides TaxID=816 RepID=UPI00202ECF12|nr:DNA (cytosine-5-)-methyltransferase [Bacteroides fragilis]MCE8586545.1 DNA (cytosine-5-)-methyltransferase [Bacteroides fragilis]MCE8590446.1 DNA (cytosine-5-)-methyltransferase [Bacteroides fragilis]MCE8659199.1 DNA (cytosine-5-)-methyltransferase [Bacteroides fragilis]MCE8663407.1 DNA (cytosine-5-)-methyltransferase [Bacteroides fragilis]MCM0265105.1 DNA (cytosine-5-)-methyltransferase [Bacteroides fragilis]